MYRPLPVDRSIEKIHALHIFTSPSGNIDETSILFEYTELKSREPKLKINEWVEPMTASGLTIEFQDHDKLLVLKNTLSSHTRNPINDDLLNNANLYVVNMRSGTNGAPRRRDELTNLIEEVRKLQEETDKLQEFAIQTLKQSEQKVIEMYKIEKDQGKSDYELGSLGLLSFALAYLQREIQEPYIEESELTHKTKVWFTTIHKRIQVCKYTVPSPSLRLRIIKELKYQFSDRITELWPLNHGSDNEPHAKIMHYASLYRNGIFEEQREAYQRESQAAARKAALQAAAREAALIEYSTLPSKIGYVAKAAASGLGSAASSAARGFGSAARGLGSAAYGVVNDAYNKFRPPPPPLPDHERKKERARSASPTRKGGKSKHVKRVKRSRRVKSSTKRRK